MRGRLSSRDGSRVPRSLARIGGRKRLAPSGVGIAMVAAAFMSAAAFAREPSAPSRFIVDAALRPVTGSADGRFAVEAEARFSPTTRSQDGRYALQAVNAPNGGCGTGPADPLFADGFESP